MSVAFFVGEIKEPQMDFDKRIEFDKPLRVLIVEDNQVDRALLENMLTESAAYTSLIKSTGNLSLALKLLEEMDFEVVVLDLNLPDSKGEETIRKLSKQFPNIAIVVNTGAYEDDLGLRTLSIGAQDFLVKGKYSAYALNKVLHYALERKRLEVELKEAYSQLQETQSQLIESEKMKVIGSLASGIAHEVKNPLATILYGVTYLIEQVKFNDEKIKFVLDNIKEASKRANDIVTDLLDFSRLHKLDKKMSNLNEIIEKAITLTHHQFEKNKVSLVKELDSSIPYLEIDPNRIEQVAMNLILNSIYAMPEGGQLKIKTYFEKLKAGVLPESISGDDPATIQAVVVLEVEDSGCGIPEDKLDKVFEPFFTTRRGSGGIGLGLTVSRNIMEIHGGKILVENREQSGVRATLIFKV